MENFYAFYEPATGRIVQRTTVYREVDDRKLDPNEEHLRVPPIPYDEAASRQAAAMGLLAVKSSPEVPLATTYIDVETKEHKPIPPQPSQYHTWNWYTHLWVFNQSAVTDIWQKIAAERDRRSWEGGVEVDGTWFHTDAISRAKYTNVLLTEAPTEEWKAMGGVWVQMGPALARKVLLAITANDKAIFEAAQAHRAALEASEDPARYDWYGGWPATYAEAQALIATIPAQR